MFAELVVVYLYKRKRDAGNCGGVHELLKVLMEKLEYQVELVLGVDDIPQPETREQGC